ncbi:hypothetical protein EDD17DRAFT_1006614 [Pisolithus thermaeus]|nr:hypothetical protein EDD17DRAFT_1006614 [Pisolithus thermaeus]
MMRRMSTCGNLLEMAIKKILNTWERWLDMGWVSSCRSRSVLGSERPWHPHPVTRTAGEAKFDTARGTSVMHKPTASAGRDASEGECLICHRGFSGKRPKSVVKRSAVLSSSKGDRRPRRPVSQPLVSHCDDDVHVEQEKSTVITPTSICCQVGLNFPTSSDTHVGYENHLASVSSHSIGKYIHLQSPIQSAYHRPERTQHNEPSQHFPSEMHPREHRSPRPKQKRWNP